MVIDAGTGNPAWLQTDWYIDPINGINTNLGTLEFPVKTVSGGIVDKWGTTSPVLKQTTTFHLVGTETIGQEDVVLRPVLEGANLIILGTLIAHGGTFAAGAVTAKAPADPGVDLQVAGFTHGETVGMLVHNCVTLNSLRIRIRTR